MKMKNDRLPSAFVMSEKGAENKEWTPPGFSEGVKKKIMNELNEIQKDIGKSAQESTVGDVHFINIKDAKEEISKIERLSRTLRIHLYVFIDPNYFKDCKKIEKGDEQSCDPELIRCSYFLLGRLALIQYLRLKVVGEDAGDRIRPFFAKRELVFIKSEEEFNGIIRNYLSEISDCFRQEELVAEYAKYVDEKQKEM